MEGSLITKEKPKMQSLLLCPHCKLKPISIIDITSSNRIFYQCECSTFRFEDSVASFISKVDSLKSEENVCFKHKDQFAQIFCKDCNYFMCKLCDSFHSSFQPTHKATALSNSLASNCIQHADCSKNFICVTCNNEICEKCLKGSHSLHAAIQLKDLYAKIYESLSFKSIDEYAKLYSQEFNEIDSAYQNQLNTLQMIRDHIDSIQKEIKEEYNQTLENNTNSVVLMGMLYSNFFRNKEFPNSISLMNSIKIFLESNYSANSKANIAQPQPQSQYFGGASSYRVHASGLVRPASMGMSTVPPVQTTTLNKLEEINKNLLLFKDESLNTFKQHKITLKVNKLSFPQRNRMHYSRKYNCNFQISSNPIQFVNDIYTHPKKISLMIELPNNRLALASDNQNIIVIGKNYINQFEIVNKNLSHQHGVVTAFCLLQNGNLISGTSNSTYGNKNTIDPIREWNTSSFECVKIISSIQQKINAIAQISSNLIAVALASNEIKVVDLFTGQITKTLNNQLVNGKLLCLLSNGDLVCVSLYDKRKQVITLWNVESAKVVKAIERTSISILKELPGMRLMFNEANKIVIYNLGNNAEEKAIVINYPENQLNPVIPYGQGVRPRVSIGASYTGANMSPLDEIWLVCFVDANRIMVMFGSTYMEMWDIAQDQKEMSIVLMNSRFGLVTSFYGDIAILRNNTISLLQMN